MPSAFSSPYGLDAADSTTGWIDPPAATEDAMTVARSRYKSNTAGDGIALLAAPAATASLPPLPFRLPPTSIASVPFVEAGPPMTVVGPFREIRLDAWTAVRSTSAPPPAMLSCAL